MNQNKEPPGEPLPEPGQRWVIRRKVAVIRAVENHKITLKEACRRYEISTEEYAGWVEALAKHGVHGLRVTRFQVYRETPTSRKGGRLPTADQRPINNRHENHRQQLFGGD